MVDLDTSTVCCMCGDVGFPDKLFRCLKCRNRFQHSYCSNYYSEGSESIQVCDWCQSEQRSSGRHNSGGGSGGSSSSRRAMAAASSYDGGISKRSEYSGDKIKHDREEGSSGSAERAGKNPTGAPSPRTATRRYKLLKDVMC